MDKIDRLCRSLIRRYNTNNPFRIADMLGVRVEYDDMGELKGYYCCMNRIRMIVINGNLDERMQRLVCGHELGHDRLHYRMATVSPLCDTSFISTARPEIEANRFAVGLFVPDDEFYEYVFLEYTDEQIAAELFTYPEIVQIKARSLYEHGVQLRLIDLPRSDFIKKLK